MMQQNNSSIFCLVGKRALVTGSTQGIGLAIAKILREYGAEVYVHCSADPAKAARIAEEIGSERYVTGDLLQADSAEKLFAVTGELDIVVANASIQVRKHRQAITDDEFDAQMNVNFRSTLKLMQTYLPAMQRKHWDT